MIRSQARPSGKRGRCRSAGGSIVVWLELACAASLTHNARERTLVLERAAASGSIPPLPR